jgi:hypothetical protein
LKLFSLDNDVIQGKKNLVNEYYDEMIFYEPSQFFYQLLTNTKLLTNGVYKHETDCIYIYIYIFFFFEMFKLIEKINLMYFY